jgi:hypothetical protein
MLVGIKFISIYLWLNILVCWIGVGITIAAWVVYILLTSIAGYLYELVGFPQLGGCEWGDNLGFNAIEGRDIGLGVTVN